MRWGSRILPIAIVIAVVVWVVLFLPFSLQNGYQCASCRSWKHVSQWRLIAVPGRPKEETIGESQIYRDFFSEAHVHEWRFAHGTSDAIVGSLGRVYSDGLGGSANDFCDWYEHDPEFRDFVQRKIETGDLSKETVIKIVGLSPHADRDERSDPATRKLAELGNRLVHERFGKK